MKTIVFVDDEEPILEGLRRNLRRMRNEWDMHFFPHAVDALEFIKSADVDVVVSDMRMPGMDGAVFLQKVQADKPGVLRLALSGYADSELILESVHAIHRYISKPAELETIRAAIENGLALRERLNDPTLRAYVGSLGALPSLPEIYDEIMRQVSSDDFSLNDIANLIESDVGLSTMVLKIVNSAFFGHFGNIESVNQAVSMLGSDTIKNIVMTEKLVKQFEQADVAELTRLNSLSKSVGALAQMFARAARLSKREIDHSQLGGMICCVGDMILLDRGEPEDVNGQVEPQLVGAHLMSLWAMPDSLVETVLRHRDPIDPARELGSHPLEAVDCVRAAWFACDQYIFAGENRIEFEQTLRDNFRHLAGGEELANRWYDKLAEMG